MKRLVALAALACACGNKSSNAPPVPVIVSFTVDNASPNEGDAVTFSWQVTGADTVSIFPQPGQVAQSPVTLVPRVTGSYILEAANKTGSVRQAIPITIVIGPAVKVTRFTALPGRASAGADVTLKWTVQQAVRVELSDGSGGPPQDVTSISQAVVNPAATTVYTLTAFAKDGHTPASASAIAVARVAPPLEVTSFVATPNPVDQGSPSTLTWDGNATSWAINDGNATTILGGRIKTLQVRPSVTTSYTLTATGPGGTTSPPPLVLSVNSHPGTSLRYTDPPPSTQPLKLIAVDCNATATCILALVAQSAVSLRGVALDLPLDSTKVSLAGLTTQLATDAFKGALGNGPLHDTLVIGAALKGSGAAPAADAQFAQDAEVARVTLTLIPEGGVGPVFAAGSGVKSFLQTGSTRNADVIAVGSLDAN